MQSFDFKGDFYVPKFWYICRKNIFFVFLIVLLGILGTFLFLKFTPPTYRAATILKMQFRSPSNFIDLDLRGLEDPKTKESNLASEIELIISDVNYAKVIDSLGLRVAVFEKRTFTDKALFGTIPFGIVIKEWDKRMYHREVDIFWQSNDSFLLTCDWKGDELEVKGRPSQTLQLPFGNLRLEKILPFEQSQRHYYFIVQSDKTLFKYLDEGILVKPDNFEANTIEIAFEDQHRQKSLAIVSALKNSYFDYKIQEKRRSYQQSLDFLREQMLATTDSLDGYEGRLSQYLESSNEGFLNMIRQVTEVMQELKKEKMKLVFARDNYEKIYQHLQSDSNLLKTAALAIVNGDEDLKNMIYQIRKLSQDWDRIQRYYKTKTHAQQQRYDELAWLKNQASYVAEVQKKMLANSLADLDSEMVSMNNLLDLRKTDNSRYKRLFRYYSIYENITNAVVSKMVAVGIAEASTTPDFQVLSPPSVEDLPIYPKPRQVYLFGTAATLTAIIGFLFLQYFREDRINSVDELAKATKSPQIGILPESKTSLKNPYLVAFSYPKSAFSEALRSVRTNIELMNLQKKEWTISITSSVPGEGKTLVASNLAGVISLAKKKTILVDLDMRKPRIHRVFQTKNEKGVSTILIGKHTIKECVKVSSVPFLSYLTSGPISPSPSEMIMSHAFSQFLENLKKEYEVIIFDTPPAGLVTDAVLLMKQVNFPLFVVRSGYSKFHFGKNIDELRKTHNLQSLYLIFNGVSRRRTYGTEVAFQYGYKTGYYSD